MLGPMSPVLVLLALAPPWSLPGSQFLIGVDETMPEAPSMVRTACHGVGKPRCNQGPSWANKLTAKALEVRLDPLGGRDQVAKARTMPRGWEGSAVPGFLGRV